ncbi:uncharacterized protein LOC110442166 [Mizuhopecten yessoensis]|uniref:Uncharacterized protein n=1 Tax=Mizuhopecten yessoensis TaxID=6573 RepID=A0A210PHU5_MIZYE|nr:uncharacterized protein LOC110442166 [Mizuhopecten yessoensis]OWF36051.1 hypothetical protein KP79_PYT22243 [Mizuhopecten yessoensis]
MAGRNAFGKSGFRPYQKGMDDHQRPPTYPEQRHVTYRVNPDGNTYREEINNDQNDRKYEQVNLPHNRDVVNPSTTQDRNIRGTRTMNVKYTEPIKIQSQRPATYRVQSDGKTYRDQSDDEQYNRKYEQASHQRNRDVVDPTKPHVFPHDRNIRGTRVTHVQQPEPNEILPQRAVTYRVLPDGKTYREQADDIQNGRKYEESNPVPQKADFVNKNIRGTRVAHAQHPEPSKFQSKEDPMDAPIVQNSTDGMGKDKIHRWTMFRLWVNREISQEVRKERDSNKEFTRRLDLPMDSMVTSVIVDPASDTNGRRLQNEYGAKGHGVQHFNILPENMYFVFGIPRAKTSMNANVSEFLETMSNAIAKSEQDVSSTKDEFSTKDDADFRRTRGLGPEVDQRRSPDQYDKHLKSEANDDEKNRRWYADDLRKSRYKHADEIRENRTDWEDDRVKKPGQWEVDNLGKSRKWQSDDYNRDRTFGAEKHSPKPSGTDNDWNFPQWDDGDLGKSRNRGTDDFRKSRAEGFTDFGKYNFDSYEMPNKKRKEHLSNTRKAGENIYATHVNK